MGKGNPPSGQRPPDTGASTKRRWRWIVATVASILVATATAFATGLGSNVAEHVTASNKPLISYSVAEVHLECGPATFLPAVEARKVLHQKAPEGPNEWDAIQELPGAAFVGTDTAELSVQGESERTVTLTGIEFQVTRQALPPGASFAAPCGGPGFGRSIEVDLDRDPPRIIHSNEDVHGMLGSELNDKGQPRPIRFPWTVSLTEPLLLYVMAKTNSCYCTWKARIPWVSGSQRGTIVLDEGDGGYRAAGIGSFPQYLPSLKPPYHRWERFRP
jgi:hypothetical protein